MGLHNLLLWNFSASPVKVDLVLRRMPKDFQVRTVALDAASPGPEEASRLRHGPASRWKKGEMRLPLDLEAYAVRYWSLE